MTEEVMKQSREQMIKWLRSPQSKAMRAAFKAQHKAEDQVWLEFSDSGNKIQSTSPEELKSVMLVNQARRAAQIDIIGDDQEDFDFVIQIMKQHGFIENSEEDETDV